MYSFKDFLSVYNDINEDVASLQVQSQNYQKQITDLNAKLQRLLQLKANADKQIQSQSQTQAQQAQSTQNMTMQPAAAPTTGAPPPSAPSVH